MTVIIGVFFLCQWYLHGVAFKHLITPSIPVISLLETLQIWWGLFPCELLLPLPFLLALEEDIHLLRIDDVLLHYVVGGVVVVN